MVYAVETNGETTYIQAKPHRAHYVAQELAGWRTEPGDGPLPRRVPNPYALTPVGRVKQIRAHARAKRRLAERRRIFESLAEGGEG